MRRYNVGISSHKKILDGITLGTLKLEYSKHAQFRADQKQFNLPHLIIVDRNVVEMETGPAGRPTKLVVRVKYDQTNDLVLVLVPGNKLMSRTLFVTTAWLNNKNDIHSTLKKERING
jgi:hypothetical protein